MTEIVRFVFQDTTTKSFYDFGSEMEITTMKYFPRVQTVDLSIDQFGCARLFTPGLKNYKVFSITFVPVVHGGQNTLTKLEAVYNQVDSYFNPKWMKLYWQYHLYSTQYAYVCMRREEFVREYSYGEITPKELTIEFIEVMENVVIGDIAINPTVIFRPMAYDSGA